MCCLTEQNVRRLARGDVRPASPHYNQSIAEDMYARMHAQFFAAASKKAKSLPGAGACYSSDGRREGGCWTQRMASCGFFISMLFAYMLERGGQLSSSMDTSQMFRAAINALAKPGFFKKGLYASGKPRRSGRVAARFRKRFPWTLWTCEYYGENVCERGAGANSRGDAFSV